MYLPSLILPTEVCQATKQHFIKYKNISFHQGQNPAVVTDATCFMGWIAEQYGLKLPRDYKVEHCTKHTGDVNDVNKEGEECRQVLFLL